MTQNLPGKRVKPGYTIERQPKPTVVRVILILAGIAAPLLVIWDLSTATSEEIKDGGFWPLYFLAGSFFVAYWLINMANETDMVEKSNDAPYPHGEIVDDPKDPA